MALLSNLKITKIVNWINWTSGWWLMWKIMYNIWCLSLIYQKQLFGNDDVCICYIWNLKYVVWWKANTYPVISIGIFNIYSRLWIALQLFFTRHITIDRKAINHSRCLCIQHWIQTVYKQSVSIHNGIPWNFGIFLRKPKLPLCSETVCQQ